MKTGLPAILTLMALAGASVAFAAFSVNAQQPITVAFQAPEKPPFIFTPADRAAFFDARVAALHAGLKLTPDQEKLWPNVEASLRDMAKKTSELHQKVQSQLQSDNLIDRLRQRGERAVARGENLQAIANAAAPLYASLNEDQKRRLPVLLHALKPHFLDHHFAMRDGGFEHGDWQRGGPNKDGDPAPGDERNLDRPKGPADPVR